MISTFKKEYIFILLIFFSSFFINWYFGFLAINPIDNFTNYNSGYLIFKGNLPFKDYWVTTGPLLDLFQFFFIKIIGLNWYSYVFQASILNSLFCCFLYFVFRKFDLDKNSSFFYSFITGFIFYSQLGTPFVDHHSSLFSIVSVLIFILAINFNNKILYILLPLFLLLGFLSKQTPVAYFAILISFLIFYNFLIRKNYTSIILLSISSLCLVLLLSSIFIYNGIKFTDFYYQYIKFASSVGEARIDSESFLKPITFSRYFLKFKWLHLSYLFLMAIIIKTIVQNKNFLTSKDFVSIFALIASAYIFIIHQLLTLNVKFIYFFIPILGAFSHIYLNKITFSKTKIFKFINIFIVITGTVYYFGSYVYKQKFQLYCLNKNKHLSPVSTKIIDNKSSFKWINCLHEDANQEINELESVINYLNINEKENYFLVTDYQFINSRLANENQIQINKWYHPGVSYPLRDNANYQYFKNYVLNKIKKKQIKSVIFIYPSHFGFENQIYFEEMFESCISNKSSRLNGIIQLINIEKCY